MFNHISFLSSDKEQLVEEEDDELKEVLDLRKIAVQLLQQEQQNRCEQAPRIPSLSFLSLSSSNMFPKVTGPEKLLRGRPFPESTFTICLLKAEKSPSLTPPPLFFPSDLILS